MKLFGKQSMYQKWYKTPNKKIVLSCLAGICSYWHEVNEAFSGFRRGRGGGGGWGKRSCCYFTIGLIFGDFPRRCHIFNPSSCRCCQLASLSIRPSYGVRGEEILIFLFRFHFSPFPQKRLILRLLILWMGRL